MRNRTATTGSHIAISCTTTRIRCSCSTRHHIAGRLFTPPSKTERYLQFDLRRWDYKHQVLNARGVPPWRVFLWFKAIEVLMQARLKVLRRMLFHRDADYRHAMRWYYAHWQARLAPRGARVSVQVATEKYRTDAAQNSWAERSPIREYALVKPNKRLKFQRGVLSREIQQRFVDLLRAFLRERMTRLVNEAHGHQLSTNTPHVLKRARRLIRGPVMVAADAYTREHRWYEPRRLSVRRSAWGRLPPW